jgi:Ion channel
VCLRLKKNSQRKRPFAPKLRDEDESEAMGYDKRRNLRLRNAYKKITSYFTGDAPDQDKKNPPRRKQYRIEPAGPRSTLSRYLLGSQGRRESNLGMVVPKSHLSLSSYLHWMFRVNFCVLFGLSCVVFFVFTTFFAGVIYLSGSLEPQCLRVGGEEFQATAIGFFDAFTLSWTTFSTVGYGSVYPALGHQNDSKGNCMHITIICSLEAFVGVLYSGFCGAILFGKVLRLQSRAHVLFSDPMVIRFGLGVHSNSEYKTSDIGRNLIPCPILEFRLLNKLFSDVGGEIIDATLNVVASIDAYDDELHEYNQSSTLSSQETIRYIASHESLNAMDMDLSENGNEDKRLQKESSKFMQRVFQHYSTQLNKNPDPSCSSVKKRIFSKVILEVSDHPFFKRVWVARHTLDENSPILTPRVRRAIRKRGGFWPEHLNNHQDIKNSLNFNQILVSLNGVSNLSASDVYAQKIYEEFNVYVGYKFVDLLYRDGDEIKVHIDLINDVREQYGGGGEPLTSGTVEG